MFDDGSVSTSAKKDEYYDDLECASRRLLLAFSPLENKVDLGAQSSFDLTVDTCPTMTSHGN